MRTCGLPRWTRAFGLLALTLAAGGGLGLRDGVRAAPDGREDRARAAIVAEALEAAATCRSGGDRARERRVLEAAIRLVPDAADLRLRLAGLLLGMRDPAAARTEVDRALALRPGSREARFLSGQVRAQAGDFPGAIRDYDLVLKTGAREGRVADLRLAQRMLERKGLTVTLEEAAERDLIPVDWPYALAARHRQILDLLTRGPSWVRTDAHRSEHFLVRTDAGAAAAAQLAVLMERARTTFDGVLPPAAAGPEPPALVLGFATRTEYVRYLSSLAGSVSFVPGTAGMFFPDARLLAIRIRGRMERALLTIYHEAFHLAVDGRVGVIPRWLDEGLAEALSARIVTTTTGVPVDPPERRARLLALRKAPGGLTVKGIVALPESAFQDARRAPDAYAMAFVLAEFLLARDARSGTTFVRGLLSQIRSGLSPARVAALVRGDPDEAARLEAAFRADLDARLGAEER